MSITPIKKPILFKQSVFMLNPLVPGNHSSAFCLQWSVYCAYLAYVDPYNMWLFGFDIIILRFIHVNLDPFKACFLIILKLRCNLYIAKKKITVWSIHLHEFWQMHTIREPPPSSRYKVIPSLPPSEIPSCALLSSLPPPPKQPLTYFFCPYSFDTGCF